MDCVWISRHQWVVRFFLSIFTSVYQLTVAGKAGVILLRIAQVVYLTVWRLSWSEKLAEFIKYRLQLLQLLQLRRHRQPVLIRSGHWLQFPLGHCILGQIPFVRLRSISGRMQGHRWIQVGVLECSNSTLLFSLPIYWEFSTWTFKIQ